jgi:hypothetical protein
MARLALAGSTAPIVDRPFAENDVVDGAGREEETLGESGLTGVDVGEGFRD